MAGGGPFIKDLIGSLGIHVDEPGSFLYRDEVIGGLSVGVGALGQPDLGPGEEKLPSAAGVFDMDGGHFPLQKDLGHKPVGPGEKDSRGDVGVMQGGPPFGNGWKMSQGHATLRKNRW